MHYQSRIATAMQALPLAPGTIATVRVQHDTGCPMLAGKSNCRCCPDIIIETGHGQIEVMPDGSVRHLVELN